MKLAIPGLLIGLMGMSVIGVAHADYITGRLWENSANVSNATIANIPVTPANVTFTANGVQFSSFGNTSNTGNGSLDYTVGSWLNSLGAAHTIVYNTPATSGDSFNNSFVALTGTAYFVNGQSFTVAHDDGLQMQVGSVMVVNAPGPTSPTTTSGIYTGPTGDYAFTIAYGECCGPPAVLETNLVPSDVPEPSTLALLGLGLAGLGFAWRKRKA